MLNDLQAHKLIGAAPAGGGGGNGWIRPSNWLPMPEILETEEKFAGLFAIYNTPENFVALYCEGDYTVNWGDGSTENFSSGDKAQHSYVWTDISSNTLTSDGYRQVIVTVIPQSGQSLTVLDLSVRHDNIPNLGADSNTPWLDIAVSMPQADPGTSIRFNWDASGAVGRGYLYSAQRIDLIHTGNMNDFSWSMSFNPGLRYARIRNSPSATTFSNMFMSCYFLTDVMLEDTSSVVDMSSMFSFCTYLSSVSLFDTSSVTNMYSMFNSCYSLFSIPQFNTSSVTYMVGTFANCYSLAFIPPLNTSSVTSFDAAFNGCRSLVSVIVSDTSLVTSMYALFGGCSSLVSISLLNASSLIYADYIFDNCSNLQAVALSNVSIDISYQNCLLSRNSIVNIFNNLGTVVSKTININGNYGIADLTATDIEIATNKGWTVLY